MVEPNLFEDCETLVKKGLGSWNSYFSKWEMIAKYEENIPESELLNEPFDRIKSVKKKKLKQSSSNKKLKKMSVLTFQKSSKVHQKKHFKMARVSPKISKECNNFKLDDVTENSMNDQMEIILKSVFLNFLRANINNLEMFAVLSQAYSNRKRIDSDQLFSQCQQALSFNKLQSDERSYLTMNQHILPCKTASSINICDMSICPNRNMYIQSLKRDLNFFDSNAQSVIDNKKLHRPENSILDIDFPKFEFNYKSDKDLHHFLMPVPNNVTPQTIIQTNFDIKTHHPALFNGPDCKNFKLKSFKLDFNHELPTNVFRKINKEYFIKKGFPEMNITQDGKRFRNLCLHERTNSISLSMENSNFITLERKPLERKCFSENILQRKRGDPSKLFFDNEKKYSESDDQTQNQVSHMYYKNKIKSQVIPKVMDDESDSDDFESIFDRIKKS